MYQDPTLDKFHEGSSKKQMQEMKDRFETMHREGPKSWFDEGYEERNMILQSGWPWENKTVLEIGCGLGALAAMIAMSGAKLVDGIDSSEEAIKSSPSYDIDNLALWNEDYRDWAKLPGRDTYDVLVLQGLLEHLTHPWDEFQWMVDTFQPKEIVVSAPCFLNVRGYIWLTLATLLKAPMSLTDLHYLHPWDFVRFGTKNSLIVTMATCEQSWGSGPKLLEDYKQRLPKVFQDMGGMPEGGRLTDLFDFLEEHYKFFTDYEENTIGAVAVYNIQKRPQNQP